MNKARDLKNIVLGGILAVSGFTALAAINLTTFSPNTPILSSEVNNNFSSLKASLEAIQAAGIADGSVTSAKLSLPLDLSGNSGSSVFSVTNTTGNALIGISGNGGIGLLGRSSTRGIVGTQGDLNLSCAGICDRTE